MSRSGRFYAAAALLVVLFAAPGASGQGIAIDPGIGPVGPRVFGGDCAGGEIYDDGTAENGYSGNPALVSNFEAVMQFTPVNNPGTYDTVCVALTTIAAGGPNLDFSIEVRQDMAGTPGAIIGTVPVSVNTIPLFPACAFFEVDISSLMLNIPGGNVFIGVTWNPMTFPSRFVCADESPATPLHPGFVNFNTGSGWQPTQTVFVNYRANLIRAIEGVIQNDADLTITKTGAVNDTELVYTITVTNNGPDDATNVVVTDSLPACAVYVSDDCGGMNVPPWTWNVGSLINGASATCNITLDATGCIGQNVSNTATVTADQTDPNPGDESSTFDITVTGPEPNPLEIPTLGTIGFAVLALLLVAGAIYMIRRRATA